MHAAHGLSQYPASQCLHLFLSLLCCSWPDVKIAHACCCCRYLTNASRTRNSLHVVYINTSLYTKVRACVSCAQCCAVILASVRHGRLTLSCAVSIHSHHMHVLHHPQSWSFCAVTNLLGPPQQYATLATSTCAATHRPLQTPWSLQSPAPPQTSCRPRSKHLLRWVQACSCHPPLRGKVANS